MVFCAHQGFAGPSACVLEKGHTGRHSYGHLAAAIAKDRERDADRYRWLRYNPTWIGFDSDFRPDEVDAAIDAAMLKTPNVELTGLRRPYGEGPVERHVGRQNGGTE